MFCRQCGTELPDGSKFCDVCGAVITVSGSAPMPPSPAQQTPPAPVQQQTPPAPVQQQTSPAPMQRDWQQTQQEIRSPGQQVYMNEPVTPKRKNGAVIAIIIIVAVLFLVAVGVIIWFYANIISSSAIQYEAPAAEAAEEAQEQTAAKPASEAEAAASAATAPESEAESSKTTASTSSSTTAAEKEPAEEEAGADSEEEDIYDFDDINELSDDQADRLAKAMSTTETPTAKDTEFIEAALWGGNDNLETYFDYPDEYRIYNSLLLEGDWKCVLAAKEREYTGFTKYFFGSANIHINGNNVTLNIEWRAYQDDNESISHEIKEKQTEKYTGTMNNPGEGFYCENDEEWMNIEKFIYDNKAMYGFGSLTNFSGDEYYVVFMRPESNMEIIDTSDWTINQNNGSKGSSSGSDNDAIVEKARKKSGAPAAELDSIDPDGTLNIHLYEDTGGHTATIDWYYINPKTLKGENLMGDPVNLN